MFLFFYRNLCRSWYSGNHGSYNSACHLYAIYANPEHIHFLVSRASSIDERFFGALRPQHFCIILDELDVTLFILGIQSVLLDLFGKIPDKYAFEKSAISGSFAVT